MTNPEQEDLSPQPQSTPLPAFQLPHELRAVFERTGSGCAAAETNLGVVHVCHAADRDIAGFANRPVLYQWQLARLPTAPVLRLHMQILDQPDNPYKFESFLNVGHEDNARMLTTLRAQESLYLVFYGDDLTYRFTKTLNHGQDQRELLGRLADRAADHWRQTPEEQRDFDQAKREFQRQFPL
jgi:hypothetical protein